MRRRVFLVVAIGVLVLGASGLAVDRWPEKRQAALDPHGTVLPATRQEQLSRVMPVPSDFDGLHAQLISGTMPTMPMDATVLSDEQCQADEHGISHCLNRLRLADGSEIEVRHPHDMHTVPCLSPGESVQLKTAPPL